MHITSVEYSVDYSVQCLLPECPVQVEWEQFGVYTAQLEIGTGGGRGGGRVQKVGEGMGEVIIMKKKIRAW